MLRIARIQISVPRLARKIGGGDPDAAIVKFLHVIPEFRMLHDRAFKHVILADHETAYARSSFRNVEECLRWFAGFMTDRAGDVDRPLPDRLVKLHSAERRVNVTRFRKRIVSSGDGAALEFRALLVDCAACFPLKTIENKDRFHSSRSRIIPAVDAKRREIERHFPVGGDDSAHFLRDIEVFAVIAEPGAAELKLLRKRRVRRDPAEGALVEFRSFFFAVVVLVMHDEFLGNAGSRIPSRHRVSFQPAEIKVVADLQLPECLGHVRPAVAGTEFRALNLKGRHCGGDAKRRRDQT